MPPHNNDTERELRDGAIPRRNRRRKPVTPEGGGTFSTLVTFVRTCRRQGTSSSRAPVESIPDRSGWDVTGNAGDVPYSLADPDGSRHSILGRVVTPMPAPPTQALPPPIQALPPTYQPLPSQRQLYPRTPQPRPPSPPSLQRHLPPHPVKPPPETTTGAARQARTDVAYGAFS